MKLVIIPPYRTSGLNYTPEKGHFMVRELVANMKKKGQLEGVDITIDEGYPVDYTMEHNRTGEAIARFLTNIDAGVVERVRECSETGEYDAIVTSGGLDPGFFAARLVSKIPVAAAVHCAVHVASFVGDRFSVITTGDIGALLVRRCIQEYGLSHKAASVRSLSLSSPGSMIGIIRKYKREERTKVPEVMEHIDKLTAQCIIAIETDCADSLILGGPYVECLEDEVRQKLDESGYSEIQLISAVPAAVEMAKTMVNMRVTQAPRAYPNDYLKVKPSSR